MTYTPNPIDTRHVILTDDILDLTERLAANTHETWAQQRIGEGWSYGPLRDDVKLEHPDLVPYDQLSEQEKEYDRKTAMETLKAIRVLGYSIHKI